MASGVASSPMVNTVVIGFGSMPVSSQMDLRERLPTKSLRME
jgi:hypothetical protein